MTDIVERLRKWEQVYKVDAHEDGALYNAAADKIEYLRSKILYYADLASNTENELAIEKKQTAYYRDLLDKEKAGNIKLREKVFAQQQKLAKAKRLKSAEEILIRLIEKATQID